MSTEVQQVFRSDGGLQHTEVLPWGSSHAHEGIHGLSGQPGRRTLVRMRGCQSSVSTLMVQSTLLMTLTSDSMISGANPNPVR